MTRLIGRLMLAVPTPLQVVKNANFVDRWQNDAALSDAIPRGLAEGVKKRGRLSQRQGCGRQILAIVMAAGGLVGGQATAPGAGLEAAPQSKVLAHAVFTVAESKRLIAKAVARMPLVQRALKRGKVIVCKGTSNTYVAEELLGRPIPHGAYVIGHVTPQKNGRSMPSVERMSEVVLVDGKYRPEMTLDQALQERQPGDVVIKGGNALDYAHRTVGVWTGSASGGTVGKILPLVTKRKAHLVIPIGLEKLVPGRIEDIAERTADRSDYVTDVPRMRVLKGRIVTEIEALQILANVEAFQASAGGVGGAEGAVWMIWQGTPENVELARAIAAAVQGEKPFLE